MISSGATAATGQTGVNYTAYTITATNSPTSFSVDAGVLPTGLSLNTGTGVISGTPSAVSGPSNVTLGASNISGKGQKVVSFSVGLGAPVVTSGATGLAGQVGVGYTAYTITATNTPTSFGVTGSLPPGLTLSGAAISGSPSAAGSFNFTVTAGNATGTGTQAVSIVISQLAPVVNSPATASGVTGQFFSYPISALNSPTSFGASNLPPFLTLTNGVISGTPPALASTVGTYNLTLSASNGAGTGTQSLSIGITLGAPAVTSPSSASGEVGVAITAYQITGSNSPSGFGATGLPANLSVSATGLITGTPTTAGTSNASVTVQNATNSASQSVSFVIAVGRPAISSAAAAGAALGQPFTYQIAATNGPTSFSASGLPAGLSVNGNTGLISGTPSALGNSQITLSASNGTGAGANAALALAVVGITSADSVGGVVGQAFSYQISSNGTASGNYSAPGLPANLVLNAASGAITGTPAAAGSSNVTLSLPTTAGVTVSRVVTISIALAAPVITSSATAPGGQSGQPYVGYQITASNAPSSFSVLAGALPPGLSLDRLSGLVSGTPSTVGSFAATLGATNVTGTGTLAVSFSIGLGKPVISSAAAANAVLAVGFNYQIAASNSPTGFNATGLPPGLVVNTANGAISGAPTTSAGSPFAVMLSATNLSGTGTQLLSISVSQIAPVINSPGAAAGVTGQPFSYQISALNGPSSFGAAGLPPGVTVNSTTGLVSGTVPALANAVGNYNATVSASNGSGTGSQSLTIGITLGGPAVTSPNNASGSVGVAFAPYQITGSNSPTSFAASALPAGLSVSATGLISGTPTTAGVSNGSVTVQNAAGFATLGVRFEIGVGKPAISSPSTAGAALGQPFSFQIAASNGPSSFSATGLPPGLLLNPGIGLISGTPTVLGSTQVSLNASNGTGTGADAALVITVVGITSADSASGVVGQAFSYQITTNGSASGNYSAVGLPAGLSLNAGTGAISGSPAAAGSGNVTVSVPTSAGVTVSKLVQVSIAVAAPSITSALVAPAATGQPFGYQITASNGPTSFEATGLPTGLTLHTGTGVISGTPVTVGSFAVTLGARNATGAGPTASLTINVALSAPAITSAPTASGALQQPFSYQISASNAPLRFGAVGLPPGLSVDAGSGSISGTPLANGSFNATVSASNASGTGTQALLITVANLPPPVAAALSAQVAHNTAAQIELAGSVSGAFTSVALAGAPLHGSALLNGTVLTYTPATGYFGADSLGYRASGPGGTSTVATVSLTVAAPGAPTASPKAVTVPFETAVQIDLSASIGGAADAVAILAGPFSGSASVNGRTIGYTPNRGFSGGDLIQYVATGPGGTSTQALISITVQTLMATAGAASITTALNTPATLDLAPFIRGSGITGVALVSPPAHGAVRVTGTRVTYTPAKNYAGADLFSYAAIGNAGNSTPANVSVIVTGRPDPLQEAAVTGTIAAQTAAAQRFSSAQLANVQRHMESLHRRDGAGLGSASAIAGAGAAAGSFFGAAAGSASARGAVAEPALNGYRAFDSSADLRANPASGQALAPPVATGLPGLDSPAPGAGAPPVANALASVLAGRSLNLASLVGTPAGIAGEGTGGTKVWAEGNISFGKRDARGVVSGYEFSTSGVSVGVDQRYSDRLTLGVGLGYARDSTEIGADGSRNQSRGAALSFYGSYQPTAGSFVDAMLGYGTLDFDTRRFVEPVNDFAYGNRKGNQLFGSLAAGHEYRRQGLMFSPYGRLDFATDRLRDGTETGAGIYALSYHQQTTSSVQGALGLRGESVHSASFGWVVPRLRVEYRHEFQGDRQAFVSYADQIGGTRYGLAGAALARNSMVLGVGSDFVLRGGWTLGVDYQLNRAFAQSSSYAVQVKITKELDARGLPNLLPGGGDGDAEAEPIDLQVDAGYAYDDNLTRAKTGPDKLGDHAYSVNVSKSWSWPLTEQTRALLTGTVGGERWRNFNGLSRLQGSVEAEYQYRGSSEFDAPTFALVGRVAAEEYESELRDGWRYALGASVRQAVTDRINLFAALSHNRRHARSAVFDTRDNSLRVNADYSLSGHETLYLGAEFRRGDVISTGSASLENVSIAKVFAQDDAYPGGQLFSYRVDGSTLITTLGYNLGLGPRDSIDFSWRRVRSTPGLRPLWVNSEDSYVGNLWSAVYLMRF